MSLIIEMTSVARKLILAWSKLLNAIDLAQITLVLRTHVKDPLPTKHMEGGYSSVAIKLRHIWMRVSQLLW